MFRRILVALTAAAVTAASFCSCASREGASPNASSAPASSSRVFSQTGSGVSSAAPVLLPASAAAKAVSKAAPAAKSSSGAAAKSAARGIAVSSVPKPKPNGRLSSTPAARPAALAVSLPTDSAATTMTAAQALALFNAAQDKTNRLSDAAYSIEKSLDNQHGTAYFEDTMDVQQSGSVVEANESLFYNELDDILQGNYSYYFDGQHTRVRGTGIPEKTVNWVPDDFVIFAKNVKLNESDVTLVYSDENDGICKIVFWVTDPAPFRKSLEYCGYDFSRSMIDSTEYSAKIDMNTGYLAEKCAIICFNGYVDPAANTPSGWDNDVEYYETVTYENPGSSVTVSKWDN